MGARARRFLNSARTSNAAILHAWEKRMRAIHKRATAGLILLLCFAGASTRTQLQAQTPAPTTGQTERPTSTPYSGDLSIFEYPDRDKKLHVDRVMDLLEIAPGKV